MVASKSKAADADKVEADTATETPVDEKAGSNKSQDLQTGVDAAEEKDAASTPQDAGETDAEGAASGEVEGGVAYGDSGFDDEFLDEFDGALPSTVGTVREGDFDVPYTYLTAEDVREGAKIRTADSDDEHVVKWNVQETLGDSDEPEDGTPVALVPKEQTPGQTFRVSELPNVDVMEKNGIDVAQFLSGLPVRADVEGEAPRRGIPA